MSFAGRRAKSSTVEVSVNQKSNRAVSPALASSRSNQVANASPNACVSDELLPADILPLRLKSVAQLTDVSEKTVRRWIQAGLLRSHKLGGARVVRKRDLRTFLDQQAGESNKDRL